MTKTGDLIEKEVGPSVSKNTCCSNAVKEDTYEYTWAIVHSRSPKNRVGEPFTFFDEFDKETVELYPEEFGVYIEHPECKEGTGKVIIEVGGVSTLVFKGIAVGGVSAALSVGLGILCAAYKGQRWCFAREAAGANQDTGAG